MASEKGGQGGQMPPHFSKKGGIAPLLFRICNIAASIRYRRSNIKEGTQEVDDKQSNNDNACVLVSIKLILNTRTVLHSHKGFV